jgi:hypothetical protein
LEIKLFTENEFGKKKKSNKIRKRCMIER